jgi:hypothetical protein
MKAHVHSMMFGREREMEYLGNIYSGNGLRTCSIMGRKGVGKSTLIEEFCAGKRTLFLQFVKESRLNNLMIMNITLSRFLGDDVPKFDTLVQYFELIGDICKEEKTVVVLDEFPYLQSVMPEAASVIQRFLDITVKNTDCMVILCGSTTSAMKEETDSMSRPLYGRFQYRLVIRPLDAVTCRNFHPGMSIGDQMSTYLTVGGIPRYQSRMVLDSYRDNVMYHYISDTRDMDEAGPEFVRNEIDNAAPHLAVLSCIANGTVRQKEIAEKLGMDKSRCSRVLSELKNLDIVGEYHPMLGSPKRPVYYIEDNIVAFHFHVVTRMAPLTAGRTRKDYAMIGHEVDTFLWMRFELLCRDFVIDRFNVKEIGKWWGRSDGEDVDIDVVAKVLDGSGRTRYLLGEFKHRSKPMGFGTLNTLRGRADELGVEDPVLALFSYSGFEDELAEYAENEGIFLFDTDALMGMKDVDTGI